MEISQELLNYVGEQVDKIISTDISGYGVIGKLYQATRNYHKEPLALRSAKLLNERLKSGDFVIILTGWPFVDYDCHGETDGPIGAAVLARSLAIGYNVRSLILTEKVLIDMVSKTCSAAGLNLVPFQNLYSTSLKMNRSVSTEELPIDKNDARLQAERLINQLNPKAVIAIEKAGPNIKGVYHHGGSSVDEHMGKAAEIFEVAKNKNILTIGIGDRGNEIGFGAILDEVKELLPIGKKCSCPCGSGVANATFVDSIIAAEVSNWGVYGLSACLALLTGKDDVMHSRDEEKRILRGCADAGGIDGVTCMPEYRVDSMPEIVHLSIVSLLKELTNLSIYKNVAPYSTPIFANKEK